MKQKWNLLVTKIDALSLRERGIMLLVVSLAIAYLMSTLVIEPQFIKQKNLTEKIKREQQQISAIQMEVTQRLQLKNTDPDAEIKQRLLNSQQQLAQIDGQLNEIQKNLVRPEKMANLLESMMKRNSKLQLVSLKSLPFSNVLDESTDPSELNTKLKMPPFAGNLADKATTEANQQGVIYKHEVEIVLQGSYPDMQAYLRDLENLSERVYWSKARLTVIEYPKASLTLNLFTLSLEKKWLNL
jgi:MSHA biogenesis protein MshJ